MCVLLACCSGAVALMKSPLNEDTSSLLWYESGTPLSHACNFIMVILLKLASFGSSLSSCCFPLTTWNENVHAGALMCFLRVCLCAHVCLCVHVCVGGRASVFVYIVCTYVCISVCVSVRLCMYLRVGMSACPPACMHAWMQFVRRPSKFAEDGRDGRRGTPWHLCLFPVLVVVGQQRALSEQPSARHWKSREISKTKIGVVDSQPWSASIQSVSI